MNVKLFINDKAKRYIRKNTLNNKNYHGNADFIERWLNEGRMVKCYVVCNEDDIKTICLLSKCDFDPYKKHDNPYILDFIYTFDEHRRQNIAYNLLLHIKTRDQITSFCSNDESENLFKKAEYIHYGEMNTLPIFRFP